MRNNKNEYEKCLFLGIEHRKSMRNANFSKYFSYSITLCFNRLTDIHGNMRNRIAKSLGVPQFTSSLVLPETSTTLHHHVVLWMGTDANGKGMMLPKRGSRPGLFYRFPSVG